MTKRKRVLITAGLAVGLAVLANRAALSAQDRYTLAVPNGLSFAEFRGYEGWQAIGVSKR